MLKNKPLLTFLGILLFITSLLFYGYAIETKSQTLRVSAPKISNLPTDFKNVKISYISDTVIGKNFPITALQSATQTIANERPDIVIFSGSLLSKDMTNNLNDEQIATILSKIQAPLGKFAVTTFDPNNVDWSVRSDDLLKKGGFTLLNNQSRHIYNHSLAPLNIIGLNAAASAEDATTLLQSAQDTPSILITTNPNNFELARTQPNIALTLASNTFGGLLNLPLINKVIVKDDQDNTFNHVRGYHFKKEEQKLLVNVGLGTPDNFPIRLFNLPTIYTISLQTTLSKEVDTQPVPEAPLPSDTIAEETPPIEEPTPEDDGAAETPAAAEEVAEEEPDVASEEDTTEE